MLHGLVLGVWRHAWCQSTSVVEPGAAPIASSIHSAGFSPLGQAGGTVALEVRGQGLRVLSDIAKVDGSTALGKEEQAIEALEEHGRGLVDGTEDRLAGLGQLLEEVQDGPRGLGVQARGGLIDKEQKGRLSGQFDTDSKTLPLLDVEAFAEHTDDGVGVVLHVQELDDFVDVGELLGLGGRGRLAEQGAELEGFADGAGLEVEILLLDVAGLALEGLIADLAVNEHLARDDTHGDTVSKAVEQSGLAGARHTHQGSEGAGLDPAVDIIQDPPSLALDLDIVADVVPVEDASGGLNDTLTGAVVAAVRGLLDDGRGARQGSLGVVLALAGGRGDEAAAEDEDLTLGLLGGDELGGEEVNEMETNDEGDDDADVAPLVGGVVRVLRVDVGVAADHGLAGDGADGRAGLVLHVDVVVAGDHAVGDELGALELSAAELVDHELGKKMLAG